MLARNRVAPALAAIVCMILSTAALGQSRPARDVDLVACVPAGAVLFVQGRGFETNKAACVESNFGELANDERIATFVDETVQRCETLAANDILPGKDETQIQAAGELLHKAIRPYWWKPSIAFAMAAGGKFDRDPDLGLVCQLSSADAKEPIAALDKLVQMTLPAKGQAGLSQVFTYKTGDITWTGLVTSATAFTLPADPDKLRDALKDKNVRLLYAYREGLLLRVSSLTAADALAKTLADPSKSKQADASVQTVFKKTAMKDWAIRWHMDMSVAGKELFAHTRLAGWNKFLGTDNVRGIGGSEGYIDKTWARLSYVDAPKGTGLLKAFKRGGSYSAALAMAPRDTTFLLGGQIDLHAVANAIEAEARVPGAAMPPGPASTATKPATASAPASEPSPPDAFNESMTLLRSLADNSNGNMAIFVTNLEGAVMPGMMGEPSLPVGMVIDIKDYAKAKKTIDDALKYISQANDEEPVCTPYRKVNVYSLKSSIARLALLKDRVVIAGDQGSVQNAIDVALDQGGGFEPDGPADTLAKACGKGQAIFQVDLVPLAKMGWPYVIKMSEDQGDRKLPLGSPPSKDKIVRMVGPEVAVMEADDGGLLLKSRGKIPLVTKILPLAPFMLGDIMERLFD